ncbi:MAG: chemotaxis protein CheA [Planctomycetes bacterium]|nr:chemotaxis protein CheA [Planctomycetota bacterium]
MSEMDEAIREFLVESYENLDRLDTEMVVLEERPEDKETLASIFRTIHTIKGTCGFLGYSKLESVAHVGESLLSRLRDGKLRIDDPITSALLAMFDAVRRMLAEIEASGSDGAGDYSELVRTLTALQESGSPPTKAAAPPPAVAAAPVVSAPVVSAPVVSAPVRAPATPAQTGFQVFAKATAQKAEAPAPARGEDARPKEREFPAADAVHTPSETKSNSGVADTNIRVDVGLLDRLMNLVGELVLARNQVLQFSNVVDDSAFAATTQRLNLVTTELQENVMKTRMQPIGNVWGKFPRIVRDVAKSCGKDVQLELEGKDTELDKTIIEAIKDPLTHIVRNSVDHGIETPEVRRAAGKSPQGLLRMRAYHEGGQVNIEISDDGAGIHTDRVKAKAIEKNLITAEQAARMSERELLNLIFLPGFSTAAKVTNVSGRGVGMDVVKTNIEKIGGAVDVSSERGKGTTLKIKIPLTLAIIPALVVNCSKDQYAIPQVSLLELVRLEGDEILREIEDLHGAPVYRLRGRLLPLVHLDKALGLADSTDRSQAINIVVLQADERQFGLIVDDINDTEEIVVKPLGKQLKGIDAFAGATIMGDGRVALILDVLGIAQRASVVSSTRESGTRDAATRVAQSTGERSTLLLFRAGADRRMAIPLSDVARLEEFQRSQLEFAGDGRVVQYRGEILPLLELSELLGWPTSEVRDPLHVVVYTRDGKSIGLVVEQILDIVEEDLVLQKRSRREGTLGSAVIQERVTDLLDVEGVLRRHAQGFFDEADLETARS